MSETPEALVQECATCGTLIDISEQEPLALMHCPTCGAAMRVRRSFGTFELLEVLGAGGMGSVYRAQDTTLNRAVALKLLRREYSDHPDFIRQFAHEAAITALINHPNVVKVYSTGSSQGHFFIAMELVDKGSLDDLITLQTRVGEAQMLEVGVQAAQGLRAAFQRGLIHRDVKPGNILFSDAHHAKIVDFGLAAPLGSDPSTGGEVWGTPYYVAPEKLESPPLEDLRSDIYSLGATLFHAVAGRAPYEAEDASMVALKHLKSQPVNLQTFAPDVSSSTAYVINRCLHKDPNQRYQNYDELIEHLEYARNLLLNPGQGGQLGKAAKPGAKHVVRAKPRVVMETRTTNLANTFITLMLVAALGGAGYLLYLKREYFFGKSKPPVVQDNSAAQAKVQQSKYEAAQEQLVNGQVSEAGAAFRALNAEQPAGPALTMNWIDLQAGISNVLAGKLPDPKDPESAFTDFENVQKRTLERAKDFNEPERKFFDRIARLGLSDDAPSPDIIPEFNKDSAQAMALLLCAAKNWEMGEMDNAQKFFEAYRGASPTGPEAWARKFMPLAETYLASYELYGPFKEKLDKVTDSADIKKQMPEWRQEVDTLKPRLKGYMLRKMQALLRKKQQVVDDYEADQRKSEAAMVASDQGTLSDIRKQAEPLALEFKFKAAMKMVKEATIITAQGKKFQADLYKRYEWLNNFKATLTQDIGTLHYTGAVLRKAGLPVQGEVADATENGLKVKVNDTSTVDVPWAGPMGVSFEGFLGIAQTFLKPNLTADRYADRLWFLGCLADLMGHPKEAGACFAAAIEKKPAYAAERALFPSVPATKTK